MAKFYCERGRQMFTDLMMSTTFDDVFKRFDELFNSDRLDFSQVFPPMNIFYQADNKAVQIEMALAGYKKDELSIEVEENKIVISGTPTEEEKKEGKYFKQKIRKQNFRRSYEIPNTYDLEKAEVTYEDGILSIMVPAKEVQLPEKKTLMIK